MVALDVDGTLLENDGSVSAAVRDAVAHVVASGAHVVISTGRAILPAQVAIDALSLTTGWAVCSNGAVVIRLDPSQPDGYEIAQAHTFVPGEAMHALQRAIPDGLFAAEVLGRGYRVTGEFPAGELTGEIEVVDFEELLHTPTTRLVLRAPEIEHDEFHSTAVEAGLNDVSYAVGWSSWMDVMPDGVSKASGLEFVRTKLGLAPGASVAIGDGRNDVEMLTWAGLGVAMGNGDDEAFEAADVSTGTVEDDGVVPVLRAVATRGGAGR